MDIEHYRSVVRITNSGHPTLVIAVDVEDDGYSVHLMPSGAHRPVISSARVFDDELREPA